MNAEPKKIAIFIVAYNAVSSLSKVLDRIPERVRRRVSEIYVFDDSSKDDTYLVGVGYKTLHEMHNLNIYRNPQNLGYGGNQKKGYEYAIKKGYDIVALLHGDGQYAPECLEELIGPVERGEADAVFGSRMMVKGAALRGGMPLYKFIGNKILTAFENRLLGMNLSEFHSGYRVYSVKALAQVPFQENSNDFHFDTEIIIQFHQHNLRIVERPIPTYYGDEICYVNGLKYAYNVVKSVIQFRLHQAGFRYYPKFALPGQEAYATKSSPYSSHRKIARMVRGRDLAILDVGCGRGSSVEFVTNPGTTITGVDVTAAPDPSPKIDRFIQQDIEHNFDPAGLGRFDYILLADILEHIRNPEEVLRRCREALRPGGSIIICVPNVAHWSVRFGLLFGRFNYRPRGIMDKTHCHFYTKRTILELIRSCGLEVAELDVTPVPLPDLFPELARSWPVRLEQWLAQGLARLWKGLFAYQFIIRAVPADS